MNYDIYWEKSEFEKKFNNHVRLNKIEIEEK